MCRINHNDYNLLSVVNNTVMKAQFEQRPLLTLFNNFFDLLRRRSNYVISMDLLEQAFSKTTTLNRPWTIGFKEYENILCVVYRCASSNNCNIDFSFIGIHHHDYIQSITAGLFYRPENPGLAWMFYFDELYSFDFPVYTSHITNMLDRMVLWAENMAGFYHYSAPELQEAGEATKRYINKECLSGDILRLGFSAGIEYYQFEFHDEVNHLSERIRDTTTAIEVFKTLLSLTNQGNKFTLQPSPAAPNLAATILVDLAISKNDQMPAEDDDTIAIRLSRAHNFTYSLYPPLLHQLCKLNEKYEQNPTLFDDDDFSEFSEIG